MSLSTRVLVPEILDHLAPDDPRARRSRGDLRRINVIMRQAGIATAMLRRHLDAPTDRPLRLLELGSGDGHAMLRLARKIAPDHPRVELVMLDMAPIVSPKTLDGFAALGWSVDVVTADAFEWLARTDRSFDATLANLFLHHFEDAALERLFALVAQRSRLLIATEPLRNGPSLAASRLVGLIGGNDVTRHDAPASVRAGFGGNELTRLWPGTALAERTAFPFTHAFAGRTAGENA